MTFWFKSISLLHSWDLTWTTLQWRTIHNSISLNIERNNNQLRWCLLRYMEYLPSQMKFIETSLQTVFFLTGSAHHILMKTRIWCLMFYWEGSTITGHHLRRRVCLFFCCRLICICWGFFCESDWRKRFLFHSQDASFRPARRWISLVAMVWKPVKLKEKANRALKTQFQL